MADQGADIFFEAGDVGCLTESDNEMGYFENDRGPMGEDLRCQKNR